MTSNRIAKATLLLSARLGSAVDSARPLSLSEYHQFARWIEEMGLTLDALLNDDARSILKSHSEADRILRLLRRIGEVDGLLDHWERLGIWVLGERQPEFPGRLRQRLKNACLPLLFGAGPKAALDQGGLCVVGSRDSLEESRHFAQVVGERAGQEGLLVISSDMRGIDRDVISATLDAGGRVICVLSDSLEKAVASRRYREALATGRASLVTPFTPDIRFAVANAMRANRYQYAMADAAIVVEARQSGGIWSGADENRKHQWVPAFVRTGAITPAGNSALVHLGLLPITRRDIEQCASLAGLLVERASAPVSTVASARACRDRPDLYAIFLSELAQLDETITRSDESIARHFGIEVAQVRAWLARAASCECCDEDFSVARRVARTCRPHDNA